MMREVGGQTVEFKNYAFKRRKDYIVDDPGLIRQIDALIQRRIAPEILKNYCFKATRTERHVVGCYSAEDGGHFRAHRDNTTLGTAHRRFAVSINLNSDFDGGDLSFPEYGPRKFKPPLGGAIVFPCSLLHAVSRVTLGSRYAFLPFLFDEEQSISWSRRRQVPGELNIPKAQLSRRRPNCCADSQCPTTSPQSRQKTSPEGVKIALQSSRLTPLNPARQCGLCRPCPDG